MVEIDNIPAQSEFERALEKSTDLNKKIVMPGELNKLAYEYLILSINTDASVRKVAFGLAQNAKSSEFHEGCSNQLQKISK